jgi:hypothetical protein
VLIDELEQILEGWPLPNHNLAKFALVREVVEWEFSFVEQIDLRDERVGKILQQS